VRGRTITAMNQAARSPLLIPLIRAVVLAAIVVALIMFGLPAVLAIGAAAST
jgi:multisubunit Na+/H+ antiporter MnhC subunit